MKKKTLLIAAACAIALLGACAKAPENAPGEPSQTAGSLSETGESLSETAGSLSETAGSLSETGENAGAQTAEDETAAPAKELPFKTGLWWAKREDGDAYYEFGENGEGGMLFQDSGAGVGFNYTAQGQTLTLQMGSVDSLATAEVTAESNTRLRVTFADGRTETWEYYGNVTLADFAFYSNEELCEMARAYMIAERGYEPEHVRAEQQPDGTISIQLYDIVEDHTSTADWFTVDRFTGKGTDIMENPIDLSPYKTAAG